jgi:hypothetical protein
MGCIFPKVNVGSPTAVPTSACPAAQTEQFLTQTSLKGFCSVSYASSGTTVPKNLRALNSMGLVWPNGAHADHLRIKHSSPACSASKLDAMLWNAVTHSQLHISWVQSRAHLKGVEVSTPVSHSRGTIAVKLSTAAGARDLRPFPPCFALLQRLSN